MNAIYVRQSVERADSISIETQIAECVHAVGKEEYKVYEDRGFSGKNTERPEFKLMMEHIKQGIIERVIVYKLDRISRSVLDFSRTMEIFKACGVEFVSVSETFDTSAPMGRAMLNIAVVFAELERETIQQRVTAAYISRSRAGFYMGGRVPYGFRLNPVNINGINTSAYVPVDEETEHLRTIFEAYSKPNTSVSDVVRYLRNNNIVKTRGIEWSASRISEILRNPIYVQADVDIYNFYLSRGTEIVNAPESFAGENGCYLYTKNVNLMGIRKDMSQYDNMVIVLAPHKGIIPSDVWIKCRLKSEQNTQVPNRRKSYRTWISGKLKCGKCGYALRYNKWRGKTAENEYYLCTGVSGNRRCEGIGAIRKSLIESEILKQIKNKVNQVKVERSQSNPHNAQINRIKAEIANREKEIDGLILKFEGGGETVMQRLNKMVDDMESEILKLKNELLVPETNGISLRQIDTDTLDEIFKSWDKVSMSNRQAIADVLISKIKVTKESIEIIWKI